MLSLAFSSQFSIGETFVIVNSKNDITDASRSSISQIYLGKKKTWASGLKIIPSRLGNDSIELQEFLKNIVGKKMALFQGYWRRKLFSGGGQVPKVFKNEMDLIKYVETNEGAVGVVTSKPKSKLVKIVSIK